MNTPIIALALALIPNEPTPASQPPVQDAPPGMSVQFDVESADLETGKDSSHLLTYGPDGEVNASLVIWSDPAGKLRFDADFADGLHLSAVIIDDKVEIDSDDAAEVIARVEAIDDYLTIANDHLAGSWLTCAAKTAATAFYCASANPVLCLSGTVLAACDCIPQILGRGECF
jgi:hypothetical protein